jgi:hypothetical protein
MAQPTPTPPDASTVRRYQENDDEAAELDANKQHEQEQLDEALTETFPASDSIAISVSQPPENKRKA